MEKEESLSVADFVQLRQSIRNLRRQKKELLARIGKLDAEITKQLPVDPDDIRPIRSTPRSGSKHGAIVRTIVRILTDSDGPVRTPDIVMVLVDELGWSYGTKEEREIARKKVVQPLRVLVQKGAVIRLHDTAKNKIGLWQWVGI
ncbi:hypothetical protein [Ferribacterium limneticum]|uniref:hypothetical protein n=1 Tax=Ferribacterium limneticum TaxID=76259 RepID=UPI001CF91BE4|nr:hypothetical protein [Ferribacterium limneticum]UCV22209.1 hypothetical protein KI613_17030 [Ferribacterium limneticum]